MSRMLDTYLRYVYQMGLWEWLAVLVGVFVMGIFCMRGFGSRTDY